MNESLIDDWVAEGRPTLIDISTPLASYAVLDIARRAQLRIVDTLGEQVLLITDALTDHAFQVIIAPCAPAPCQVAVAALAAGRATAVITSDEPDGLHTSLAAIAAGHLSASATAVQTARDAPSLDARQREILTRIMQGEDTHQIATRIAASESTVKREVAVLCATFGTRSRAMLRSRAIALGFDWCT